MIKGFLRSYSPPLELGILVVLVMLLFVADRYGFNKLFEVSLLFFGAIEGIIFGRRYDDWVWAYDQASCDKESAEAEARTATVECDECHGIGQTPVHKGCAGPWETAYAESDDTPLGPDAWKICKCPICNGRGRRWLNETISPPVGALS